MASCILTLALSHGISVFIITLTSILFAVLCIIMSTILIFHFGKEMRFRFESINPNDTITLKLHRIWTWQLIMTAVLFSLASIVQCLHGFFMYHNEYAVTKSNQKTGIDTSWVDHIDNLCDINLTLISNIIWAVTIMLQSWAYTSLLYFYFTRLIIIFYGSVFAIPKRKIKIVFGLSLVPLVANIPMIYFFIQSQLTISSYFIAFAFVIYGILSVYVGIILIKQFRSVIDGSGSQRQQSRQLFRMMAKFTLLLIVSIFCTVLLVTFAACAVITGQVETNVQIRASITMLAILDSLINIICVSLQFTFATSVYRVVCGRCNEKMNKMYEYSIEMT